MSDGTMRALGVLIALFQGNPDYLPKLVGIEEPETALHPAASAALREALQKASERTQVIVTSIADERNRNATVHPHNERKGTGLLGIKFCVFITHLHNNCK